MDCLLREGVPAGFCSEATYTTKNYTRLARVVATSPFMTMDAAMAHQWLAFELRARISQRKSIPNLRLTCSFFLGSSILLLLTLWSEPHASRDRRYVCTQFGEMARRSSTMSGMFADGAPAHRSEKRIAVDDRLC
jgi:hypothetical protein